jgi:hypothetical protein
MHHFSQPLTGERGIVATTGTAAGFSGFAQFWLVYIAPGFHNDHGNSLRQLKDRLPVGLLPDGSWRA